ncbi:MAG: 4Fe-4S dicluster domain-containing protein [Methanomassiliicoccales archaeon]|nr:4Fe-4S dicluster domain-containing protein [Methanomassiliicoccales archaeon]
MSTTESAIPHPVFDENECKGCGRCVAACPQKVLRLSGRINRRGYNAVEYIGSGCVGCAICFYNCPEPYAIMVQEKGRK